MINYKTFIIRLNEGLIKTIEIDKSIRIIERNLSEMGSFQIEKDNNKFSILFYDLKNIHGFDFIFSIINNLGWFPSSFKVWKSEKVNIFIWKNLESFISLVKDCEKVLVYFESSFDLVIQKPDFAYHTFCYLNLKNIREIGLVPKNLKKITSHPERIYLSMGIESVIDIGKKIKSRSIYNDYNKYKDIDFGVIELNLKELDITCYKDPNYNQGFYILQNIPKEYIKIIDIII